MATFPSPVRPPSPRLRSDRRGGATRRGERGAAMVEFALILPLLLLLLLGVVELG
ncbi:MAG TPA: TadE/TadG family type IV pilus assembly protein [Microthrixaceae bacterium]|nr:TadE/TadG family type IV pilus assembly protein [Microthrixaceae bacterium]